MSKLLIKEIWEARKRSSQAEGKIWDILSRLEILTSKETLDTESINQLKLELEEADNTLDIRLCQEARLIGNRVYLRMLRKKTPEGVSIARNLIDRKLNR